LSLQGSHKDWTIGIAEIVLIRRIARDIGRWSVAKKKKNKDTPLSSNPITFNWFMLMSTQRTGKIADSREGSLEKNVG
jgi:hypothetical protein